MNTGLFSEVPGPEALHLETPFRSSTLFWEGVDVPNF